jgi:hypothetical protein
MSHDDRDPYTAGRCWRCHRPLDQIFAEHGSHFSCDDAAAEARDTTRRRRGKKPDRTPPPAEIEAVAESILAAVDWGG